MTAGLQAWQGRVVGWQNRLVDMVLPPACLICRARLERSGCLCPDCWAGLDVIEAPVCDRLGLPFAFDPGGDTVSVAGLSDPPPWRRSRAAVVFDDASRRLVHALKYHDRHEAAALMARMMARAGAALVADADVIMPVPLHRARLWSRRYNQSALLAARLAEAGGVRFEPDWLRRTRATAQQVGLDHAQRRRNVRGAFEMRREHVGEVHGRRILLVDDVMTTGATARACVEALMQAGAAGVDVLLFALVCDRRKLDIMA